MGGDRKDFDETDFAEARRRLAEVEAIAEVLEARLAVYQRALEDIRACAGDVLDS